MAKILIRFSIIDATIQKANCVCFFLSKITICSSTKIVFVYGLFRSSTPKNSFFLRVYTHTHRALIILYNTSSHWKENKPKSKTSINTALFFFLSRQFFSLRRNNTIKKHELMLFILFFFSLSHSFAIFFSSYFFISSGFGRVLWFILHF